MGSWKLNQRTLKLVLEVCLGFCVWEAIEIDELEENRQGGQENVAAFSSLFLQPLQFLPSSFAHSQC